MWLLLSSARSASLHKEQKMENKPPFVYTDDQLMARLKFFVGVCLALTLTGIVFVVLYSIIFVTQPLDAMSPIDQKFFELIVPIATFLTGTLSGIMLAGHSKEDKEAMLKAQEQQTQSFKMGIETTAKTTKALQPKHEPTLTLEPHTGYKGKLAPPRADHPEI
jgi:hypothetical protein